MFKDFLTAQVRSLEKSAIQTALQKTSNANIISFSLGRPDNSLLVFPALSNTIDEDILCPENLQYAPPSLELKTCIVELMKERQIFCTPDQVFLTTGAQQAMTLLTKLFTSAGDTVLADQLTYPGFIQVAQTAQINLLPLPVCFQKGVDIEDLEYILEKNKRPRFLYTVSEGHNPLGISLSEEKRIHLTKLAEHYQIPIIEDDAYGFLNYDEVSPPPLKFYWSQGVFYIGSFSKILAPSMRVGWIIAPESVIEKLEILKEGFDLNTSTLSQQLISFFFKQHDFKNHISKLKREYKKKRDHMVESLKRYLPQLEFSIPKSGFFVWGKLPAPINTEKLFKLALEKENVSFLPGNAFLIGKREEASNCMRLSFAFCPIDLIEAGVQKLAKAIDTYQYCIFQGKVAGDSNSKLLLDQKGSRPC